MLDKNGVDDEVIEHDDLLRRYPQFNQDNMAFGFYVPSTGVLVAKKGCLAVAQAIERQRRCVRQLLEEPAKRDA